MKPALLLAAAAMTAFVLLGRSIGSAPTQADVDAARFGALLGIGGLGPVLELFNRMGQALVWAGVIILLGTGFAIRRRWDVVALLVLAEAAEVAVAFAKTSFDRPRPLPLIGDELAGADVGSYPSGQVTRVTVTLGMLALYATPPRWRPLVVALTAMVVAVMALARIAVLEHWLTDTVGGLLLATAWLAAMAALAHRFRLRSRSRPQGDAKGRRRSIPARDRSGIGITSPRPRR